jgi:hypothetical protein
MLTVDPSSNNVPAITKANVIFAWNFCMRSIPSRKVSHHHLAAKAGALLSGGERSPQHALRARGLAPHTRGKASEPELFELLS